MPDHYAVIGNPIAHSRSPDIHSAFAVQCGIDLIYERILAPLDGFADTLAMLKNAGYKGANVTVPFKLQAYHLASQLSERAMDAGAVNTISFVADGMLGDNTDGVGLVDDIRHNLGITLAAKRILLIGAGGAAEGVLHPILEQQPSLLIIANRSLDKALSMVRKVEAKGDYHLMSVSAHAFAELHGHAFDIVINATSAGLSDSELPLPQHIFAPGALAYDMMYGRVTPFMAFASSCGAAVVVDGLGMLVEQAAAAFYSWHQVRPHTRPVIDQIRRDKSQA